MHEASKKLRDSKTSSHPVSQTRVSAKSPEREKRKREINYHQFPSLFPKEDFDASVDTNSTLKESSAIHSEIQPRLFETSLIAPHQALEFADGNGNRSVVPALQTVSSDSLFASIVQRFESPCSDRVPTGNTRLVPPGNMVPCSRESSVAGAGIRKFASFTTFVEGPSNRLAVTAAQLAVQFPGRMNPVYISGSTSLGKTHLLEGIYSESRKHKGRKPVMFMSAEQFTTAFIESLTKQGVPSFRNKFRGISTLLIDDLHFFSGKASTQTELLRTIDTLRNQGVQLVITGDKPLKALTGIRPELLSRLEAGMVCEIQPPDKEMLYTIFRQMIAQRGIPLSEEVSRFVVSRLNTHARQLSGALNRLHTTFLATEKPITVATAEDVLDDLIRCNRKTVRLADIDRVVCETFGIGNQSLQSKSRAKQVAYPRMLAMWLARKYTRSALSEIGKYFGDRAHSTVVSAQKKVESWINDNTEIDCFDQQCEITDILQKVERLLQAG